MAGCRQNIPIPKHPNPKKQNTLQNTGSKNTHTVVIAVEVSEATKDAFDDGRNVGSLHRRFCRTVVTAFGASSCNNDMEAVSALEATQKKKGWRSPPPCPSFPSLTNKHMAGVDMALS